jgi:hypothetical protein
MDERAFQRLMRRWEAGDVRAEERHRALLERHRALLERHERSEGQAEARHRALLERQQRSERLFVSALSEINKSMQRNNERLDDMGEAIRANTRAVLSVLDRLEPRSG